MDLVQVKPIEEPFFYGPEIPLILCFRCPIPDRRVKQGGADLPADYGELFIVIRRAMVATMSIF